MPRTIVDTYDAPLHMRHGTHRFHLMAKPGGCACNLNCTYCFYLSKSTLPNGPKTGRMSDATLETFIRKYIEANTGDEVVFSWQGGEPSLLGLPFYRRVVELQKRYAKPGQRIENDLQTNGTLLDDEWCAFLAENRFLVGLSVDGPAAIHDRHRVTKGNQPTLARILETARRLHRHGVPFNTLTCVHRDNARRPVDIYRFLRDEIGSTRMQFIPIVEHRNFEGCAPGTWNFEGFPRPSDEPSHPGHPLSIVKPWSVSSEDWGYFLCKIFDRWIRNDVGKVYVIYFEDLIGQRAGLPAQACISNKVCGSNLAIESDGGVYACDHFVYPEHRRGNLLTDDLASLVLSRDQVKFGYAKSETLPRYCRDCAHLRFCWGECPKNRLLRTDNGEPGLNYLCSGYRRFFDHAFPEIDRLVRQLSLRERVARGH